VKLRSRLFTALSLLPSIATIACEKTFIVRHNVTKRLHTAVIAPPLSLRKSAMVLKSGTSRLVSQISSRFRCASRSKRRLDWMRLR